MNIFIQALRRLGFLTVILSTLRGLTKSSVPQAVVKIPVEIPKSSFRSTPLTPGSQLLSFDPALAIEIGETKAIILQKVWEWMQSNHFNEKMDHCIDGQWYSYNSAREWRDKHFTYLSVPTVKAAFQWLEKEGYVQRAQYRKERGDERQWVTIPAASRARIDAISAANTPQDKKNPLADKKNPPRGEKLSPTIEKLSKNNHQSKNTKSLTTTAPDEAEIETQIDPQTVVVVAPLPHPTIQAESGEYSIKAEASPTDREEPHGEPLTVEAGHKDDSTTTASSPKVPQKGSSPAAADVLRADLIRFGVLPNVARRLVDQHGEHDTRRVLRYAQDDGALGAGFVVAELDHRRFGVLDAPTDLAPVNKYMQSLSTAIDQETPGQIEQWRLEALRRSNEQLAALEAEEAAAQMLNSDPSLEYA